MTVKIIYLTVIVIKCIDGTLHRPTKKSTLCWGGDPTIFMYFESLNTNLTSKQDHPEQFQVFNLEQKNDLFFPIFDPFFGSRLKTYPEWSYFDVRFVFNDLKYIRIARSPSQHKVFFVCGPTLSLFLVVVHSWSSQHFFCAGMLDIS